MATRKKVAAPVIKEVPEPDYEEKMQILQRGESPYLLVNIISKRVKSYHGGEKPLVDLGTGADPLDLALEELKRGKLVLMKAGKEAKEEPAVAVVAAPEPKKRAPKDEEEE